MKTLGVETVDGAQIEFADMGDEHLANWIFHAEKHEPYNYDDHFRSQLRAEAQRRGISDETIAKADGSFMRGDVRIKFDKRYGKYVEVQE